MFTDQRSIINIINKLCTDQRDENSEGASRADDNRKLEIEASAEAVVAGAPSASNVQSQAPSSDYLVSSLAMAYV